MNDSSQSTGADRREYERFEVTWCVDCETENTFLYAAITNISLMGIFVETNEPLPVGTELTLKFAPSRTGELFVLEGIVQWVNPVKPKEKNLNPGMGIQFSNLTTADREKLVETIHTIAYLREAPILN